MKKLLSTYCVAALVGFATIACGARTETGSASGSAPAAEPAPAVAEAPAAPAEAPAAGDAAKFAGKWKSDGGQFTEYVYEDGKLYVLFGANRNECTLADGQISYSASGMTTRMKYSFVDADTVEYTDPSMPTWKLVQKRQ